MKKFIPLLILLTPAVWSKTSRERVELMKYVIKQEAKMRIDTKWEEASWFRKLKLVEEAYAYQEGETCLVLGFKSQFKNGMCRLSYAEGGEEYKKQCSSDTLPCNPQVFGKPSEDKPFCIKRSVGRELSKACAKETFVHLAKISNSESLKGIENKSVSRFNLEEIDFSTMDPALEEAFKSVFKSSDSSLEAAVKFTRELCEDLKLATQTGHQPLDLKTCQAHLALLEKGNQTQEDNTSTDGQDKVVQKDLPVTEPEKNVLPAPTEDECEIEPVITKQTEENIEDVKKITQNDEAKAWLMCINKLEAHEKVAPQLEGIEAFHKERDRYHGYWHQLDGQKQFGIMCDPKSENDTHETFTFLGPHGFTQVKSPANEHTGIINRMSYKGKEYYIVQDMLGDYFELHEKDKVSNDGAKEDIRNFHKKGKGTLSPLEPVTTANLSEAKMCVRQRMDEYLRWITYPDGILPTVKDYNADIGVYNESFNKPEKAEGLRTKYGRTVEQIKKEQFEKVMKDVPDCQGILSEEDFSKEYDKVHAERIKLYNKFRQILGFDNN